MSPLPFPGLLCSALSWASIKPRSKAPGEWPSEAGPQASSRGLVVPVTGFWLSTRGQEGNHTCHLGVNPDWHLWWHLGTTDIVEREPMAHQPDGHKARLH